MGTKSEKSNIAIMILKFENINNLYKTLFRLLDVPIISMSAVLGNFCNIMGFSEHY